MDGIEGAAVLDTPAEIVEPGAEVVDQPTDGTEIAEPTAEGTEPTEEGTERQDGRTLPKNIQTTLKALKDAHPELAKDIEELRKGFFDSRQHREFFKNPAEARQAKATLDLLGGSDGIAKFQSEIAVVEQIDASIKEGDPQVIEDIATDFPEGFKKLAGPYLDKLQRLDPAAYASTLQPHVFASMEAAGLGSVIEKINQCIAANDTNGLKDIAGKLQSWFGAQKQQAGQRVKTDDPERLKLQNEQKQFNEQREQAFREDVGKQTVTHQNDQITKTLAPYLKSKPLGADAKTDLVDGVNREVNRLLKADPTYHAQVKAMLNHKGRDQQKIVQYINAAVAEAAPKAVKAVWGRRYGSFTPAKTAPTAQQQQQQQNATQSGPIKLAQKPNREDVDWAKDPSRVLFVTSKAYMKSGPYKGRLVTWK